MAARLKSRAGGIFFPDLREEQVAEIVTSYYPDDVGKLCIKRGDSLHIIGEPSKEDYCGLSDDLDDYDEDTEPVLRPLKNGENIEIVW